MPKGAKEEEAAVAYALGGLGGNNLFGLGFLAAAIEKDQHPVMISATSGQIYLIWLFQKARQPGRLQKDYQVNDLREFAAVYSEKVEIRPISRMASLLAFEGACGAYEHLLDFRTLLKSGVDAYNANLFGNLCPAKVCQMHTKGDDIFKRIADDFNADKEIGIAFNSYNPTTGTEYVYLNEKAEKLLHKDFSGPSKSSTSSFRQSDHHVTVYRPIDADGVRDALWLYEYGFDGHRVIDGCYFRQVMLHELAVADLIVSVRPLRSQWTAELPEYWFDKEDLKTKVFFNAAYAGERFRLELMNRLLKGKQLTRKVITDNRYHKIDFLEIEPSRDWPAASLFAEEMEMFEDGFEVTMHKLASHRVPVPAIRPAAGKSTNPPIGAAPGPDPTKSRATARTVRTHTDPASAVAGAHEHATTH